MDTASRHSAMMATWDDLALTMAMWTRQPDGMCPLEGNEYLVVGIPARKNSCME